MLLTMSRTYPIAIRIFAVFGIITFGAIVLFTVAITWKMPLHNYQLWKMQRNFRSTMQSIHPVQSELRAEMADFGNFGNSNHCDYMVGEFRSSHLSKEKLRRAYAAVATSSFIGNRLVETDIYFTDEDIFTHYPWSEWLEKYIPDNRGAANENTYLIFSEDDGNPPDGDIRCN